MYCERISNYGGLKCATKEKARPYERNCVNFVITKEVLFIANRSKLSSATETIENILLKSEAALLEKEMKIAFIIPNLNRYFTKDYVRFRQTHTDTNLLALSVFGKILDWKDMADQFD